MSWRKITFIIVALIILLGGSAALSMLFVSLKPEPRSKQEMDLKRFVKAETVHYNEVISSVTRPGRVVSSSEVTLVSEASGKIEKGDIVLRKGTSFKKGQLIAIIYKDEVELALKARKSRYLTTISTMLPDLKVDYPDNFEEYMSFFNAIEMGKNLPDLPELENGKLKIFLSSRNVLSEYYGILQDEKRLSRHSLYAPFNGTFTLVNFEVGGYVNIGGQIAKMIRTDQLEVEVPVENKNDQSQWIRIGDKVKVSSKNSTKEKPGIVVRKSPFVNPDYQSRNIFVKVNSSAKDELLMGEYYEVEFPGQKIQSAMVIPRNAVFNSNEVFIVVDGKLKKREINIIKLDDETLVFNGLEPGSKVVVEPLINVKENSPVGIQGEEVQNKKPAKKGQKNRRS